MAIKALLLDFDGLLMDTLLAQTSSDRRTWTRCRPQLLPLRVLLRHCESTAPAYALFSFGRRH
ncbi:hypothetical protein [Micromonospora orduensis]|uniref:hypothetical protein n=1 Tax=Micromonospora orduensis TaxID=1420891 RepID=UPI0033DB789A